MTQCLAFDSSEEKNRLCLNSQQSCCVSCQFRVVLNHDSEDFNSRCTKYDNWRSCMFAFLRTRDSSWEIHEAEKNLKTCRVGIRAPPFFFFCTRPSGEFFMTTLLVGGNSSYRIIFLVKKEDVLSQPEFPCRDKPVFQLNTLSGLSHHNSSCQAESSSSAHSFSPVRTFLASFVMCNNIYFFVPVAARKQFDT